MTPTKETASSRNFQLTADLGSKTPVKAIKIHRILALCVALPLLANLLTGVAYRTGYAWFSLPKGSGNWLMDIHSGEWLGSPLSSIYLLLAGGGLIAMALTGIIMLCRRGSKNPSRMRHRLLGWIMLVPLLATAITGIIYKIGSQYFGLSDAAKNVMMQIHEGSWLGRSLTPIYVCFLGFGLLFLIASGLKIWPWHKKRNHSAVG